MLAQMSCQADPEMAAHPHHNETLSSLRFPNKTRSSVRRDDCLSHDCQILTNLDFETPFRDIYDAVDRLCSFHVRIYLTMTRDGAWRRVT